MYATVRGGCMQALRTAMAHPAAASGRTEARARPERKPFEVISVQVLFFFFSLKKRSPATFKWKCNFLTTTGCDRPHPSLPRGL